MPRAYLKVALAIAVVILLAITVPIPFLNSSQYQELTGGVQALGVTAALVFGALTLHSDSRNRRIDRVLDLHRAITDGDLQLARHRLLRHLRKHSQDGVVPQVRLRQFREGGDLGDYGHGMTNRPGDDAARILRYMERVNAARLAGILDFPLLHQLIGIHVLWWNNVIIPDVEEPMCKSIAELAGWVVGYAESSAIGAKYLEMWDVNFKRDFGYGSGL